jgi:hypothetical protein
VRPLSGRPATAHPQVLIIAHGLLGPVSNAVNDVNLALALAADLNLSLSPTVLDLLGRVADAQWPDFSAVIEGLHRGPVGGPPQASAEVGS